MTAINCQQTRIETTHRILNGDLNEHGTLFGGRLLETVDAEASVAAMRVARATLVTATMDHVQFVKPFHLQDAMIRKGFGRALDDWRTFCWLYLLFDLCSARSRVGVGLR